MLDIRFIDKSELSTLCEIYDKIVGDDVAGKVFWDGTINSRGDFVSCMSNWDNIIYGVYDGDKWFAVAWINCFVGKTAQLHYCVFRDGHGRPEIGRDMVNFIMHLKYNGEYCIDALVGITPKENRLAVRYMKKSGFSVLEDTVYYKHAITGEFIPVVTSICTRGGL